MKTVSGPTPTDSVRSSSTTASGIFRGLLGNMGSHVLGSAEGPTLQDLQDRISYLENENGVLKEELEAKISENENLVIENSEVRRSLRETESRLKCIDEVHSQCEEESTRRDSELQKLNTDKITLMSQLDRLELECDSLRRDLNLQNDTVSRLRQESQTCRVQLDSVTELKVSLESQLGQLQESSSRTEAVRHHLDSDLKASQHENRTLQSELETSHVTQKSLQLRLDKLEEEMRLMSVVRTTPSAPTISTTRTTHPPDPCCDRAEYYRDKCRNMEHSLTQIRAKFLNL
jgi:chromosome segregation ATPase